jgi:drug/metabolite transporter (DMT)-like permease
MNSLTPSHLKIILAMIVRRRLLGLFPDRHSYRPASLRPRAPGVAAFSPRVVVHGGGRRVQGIHLPKCRDVPLLFALGFFAVSLHHVALNFGQQSVSAGASSVLAQSTPLFSTLLARFLFKDR